MFAIVAILVFTQAFTKNVPMPPVEVTPEAAATTQSAKETAVISRVIDGDTVELDGGKRVRLVGIDSPEIQDLRFKIQEECYSEEAKEETVRLLDQKSVRLEKDVSETDKYGRLLRYVYVEGTFINDYLVRQGFARVMGIPPDTKFYGQLKEAEKEAREAGRGLWKSCGV